MKLIDSYIKHRQHSVRIYKYVSKWADDTESRWQGQVLQYMWKPNWPPATPQHIRTHLIEAAAEPVE